jgi:hypothetical protein
MKRYSTPKELGRAWINEEITELSVTSRNGVYKLSADPDTIWNGDRLIALVKLNRGLDLVLVLRPGSASMGAAARNCMQSALENVANHRNKITYLDSLQRSDLSTCPLKTIQDLVLSSSIKALKGLIVSFRVTDSKTDRFVQLKEIWEKERQHLDAIGLTIPQELETKKLVAIAKHRILDE